MVFVVAHRYVEYRVQSVLLAYDLLDCYVANLLNQQLLHYHAINLVALEGVEPPTSGQNPGALTLSYKAIILVVPERIGLSS